MSSHRLRWGIMGTASIASRRVIPALKRSLRNQVAAIASRDAGRAVAAAAEHDIPRAVDGYQALLEDRGVEAVYIPLPNHLHVEWTLRALEAGKHVLCEKPIGVDAAEARTLRDRSRDFPALTVMEAFMYRCHPRWEQVLAMVRGGAIGELGAVHTLFAYDNRNPLDIRNDALMGGGGWLDIGCYGVSVARWLFGGEPVTVRGVLQVDPVFNTDRLAAAVLGFAQGVATVTSATQLAWHQSVVIHGSTGRIELPLPFNPPSGEPTRILHQHDGATTEIVIAPADQFEVQVDRFAAAVLDGAPLPLTLDDSVANMAALDQLRSGRGG